MELLNSTELAKRLKMKADTVRRWARSGIIPCMAITRRKLLFDWEEVTAVLRKKKRVVK